MSSICFFFAKKIQTYLNVNSEKVEICFSFFFTVSISFVLLLFPVIKTGKKCLYTLVISKTYQEKRTVTYFPLYFSPVLRNNNKITKVEKKENLKPTFRQIKNGNNLFRMLEADYKRLFMC